MTRNKILIYSDIGTNDVSRLESLLKEKFSSVRMSVHTVSADEIKFQNVLNENVLAFFMSGGEADAYAKQLGQTGKKAIYSYIEKGGFYYGICAGAYFACDKIVFQDYTRNEKIISNDCLGLVCVEAHGTIAPYLEKNNNTLQDMVIDLKDNLSDQFYAAHYHKGPYFVLKNNVKATVLAHYVLGVEKLPAVITQPLGQGQVILSGVHWENSALEFEKLIKVASAQQYVARKIAYDLRLKESLRQALAQKLMQLTRNL